MKFLYTIIDTSCEAVRYIGQSNDPERRFKEHLRGQQQIDLWMRRMIESGFAPRLEIISRHRKINRAERQAIRREWKRNPELLNQLIPTRG